MQIASNRASASRTRLLPAGEGERSHQRVAAAHRADRGLGEKVRLLGERLRLGVAAFRGVRARLIEQLFDLPRRLGAARCPLLGADPLLRREQRTRRLDARFDFAAEIVALGTLAGRHARALEHLARGVIEQARRGAVIAGSVRVLRVPHELARLDALGARLGVAARLDLARCRRALDQRLDGLQPAFHLRPVRRSGGALCLRDGGGAYIFGNQAKRAIAGSFAATARLNRRKENGGMRKTGLIAAGVLAAALAMPVAAQQKPPAIAPAPASDPDRVMPVLPSQSITYRNEVMIVGSSSMKEFTEAVTQRFARTWGLKPAVSDPGGTGDGFKHFCAGVGVKFADIVAASRRMSKHEFDVCQENGVIDIIELIIGFGAVVAAVEKGDPVFNVTLRDMYLAVAKEIPRDGDFIPNPYKKWSDVNPNLPDLDILVLAPGIKSGTRDRFNDRFMEGGCRGFKEIRVIFSAAERVGQCTEPREDGRFEEIPEPYIKPMIQRLIDAPPGAVAIMPESAYSEHQARLEHLPVRGVLPTLANIETEKYPMTRRLYYYVKRAHMRNAQGVGIVRGLREFMSDLMSEQAIGPGGYLENLGLIVMTPEMRATERRKVLTLQRFVK
ncbi:MAG: substrate-binding domain-containing protein [Rhodospirillales bacterium]|nr:substrate-binding domain-containing protein [Rhodospirillales bacterium]